MELFIPIIPLAKGRPRLSTRGGFARAYTPAKTREYEKAIAEAVRKHVSDPLQGPLCVSLTFTMPIPTSLSNKAQEALIGKPHIKRPDVDNAAKSVLDALNGIAWVDDSQIWKLTASKVYGLEPGVRVVIQETSAFS